MGHIPTVRTSSLQRELREGVGVPPSPTRAGLSGLLGELGRTFTVSPGERAERVRGARGEREVGPSTKAFVQLLHEQGLRQQRPDISREEIDRSFKGLGVITANDVAEISSLAGRIGGGGRRGGADFFELTFLEKLEDNARQRLQVAENKIRQVEARGAAASPQERQEANQARAERDAAQKRITEIQNRFSGVFGLSPTGRGRPSPRQPVSRQQGITQPGAAGTAEDLLQQF